MTVSMDFERETQFDQRRAYRVDEVVRLIEDRFKVAFPRRIWVVGLAVHSRATPGAWRFELSLDRADDDLAGSAVLPAVVSEEAVEQLDEYLGREVDAAVGDLLVDGQVVRTGGLLRYDSLRQQVRLEVSALDPGPTAEDLAAVAEQRRRWARAERLAERQRALTPPLAPLQVAVVGEAGNDGAAITTAALSASAFGVVGRRYEPALSGPGGGAQLAAAVDRAARDGPDLVLLVRDARRPLRLAPFNSTEVATAIASARVPVLTGIEAVEPTVADEVAHQSHGSPDGVAAAVIARLGMAASRVEMALERIGSERDGALDRAGAALEAAMSSVRDELTRAEARAARARARQRRWMWVASALIALAAVLLTVFTRSAWWLIGLGLAAGTFLGYEQWTARRGEGEWRRLLVDGVSFGQALERLDQIGRELSLTSSPERVRDLEDEAEALAEHCRQILGGDVRVAAGPTLPDQAVEDRATS